MMRGRLLSFLVLTGLFFSTLVMPAIAHAGGHSAEHAGEMLDVHEVAFEIGNADHSKQSRNDTDMPCHAVSHHHCSAALQLDALRIGLTGPTKANIVFPAASAPLTSRSQAPPLNPPLA
jgi:hypothetical protein